MNFSNWITIIAV